jgi:hypothetical protein
LVAAESSSGGEGGGGGGGGGGIVAKQRAAEIELSTQSQEALKGEAAQQKILFGQYGRFIKDGALVQLGNNFRNLNDSVFQAAKNFMDLSSAGRDISSASKDLLELSRTGIIEVTALATDLGAGVFKDRASMQATAKTVMDLAGENTFLIGTLGNNLEEVATALYAAQNTVDDAFGDNLLGRLTEQDRFVVMADMLAEQKRLGVQTSNKNILESQQFREEIMLFQQIAASTGMTVTEVMKLQKETKKTVAELVFNGVMTREQGQQANKMNILLNKIAPGVGEFVSQAIMKGGTEQGLQQLLSESGVAELAQIPGNMERLSEIISLSTSGRSGLSDTETADEILRLARSVQGLSARTGGSQLLAANLREGSAFAQAIGKMVGDAAIASNDPNRFKGGVGAAGSQAGVGKSVVANLDNVGSQITQAVNDLQAFLTNNFSALAGLVPAITANTIALVINTIAHGGGGLIGNLFKKVPGMNNPATRKILESATKFKPGGGGLGSLKGATTSLGAGAGAAGAGAGALIGTAAAMIIGSAIALAVGYAIGTWLEEKFGNPGSWFYDTFIAGPGANERKKFQDLDPESQALMLKHEQKFMDSGGTSSMGILGDALELAQTGEGYGTTSDKRKAIRNLVVPTTDEMQSIQNLQLIPPTILDRLTSSGDGNLQTKRRAKEWNKNAAIELKRRKKAKVGTPAPIGPGPAISPIKGVAPATPGDPANATTQPYERVSNSPVVLNANAELMNELMYQSMLAEQILTTLEFGNDILLEGNALVTQGIISGRHTPTGSVKKKQDKPETSSPTLETKNTWT